MYICVTQVYDVTQAPPSSHCLDHLALAKDYARALALADAQAQPPDAHASDDSDNDSLGIDDPDLLDIPPPMTYEAWSVDEMECGAE